MATGEARAMLDALMGPDRDAYIPNISKMGLSANSHHADAMTMMPGQNKRKKSCFDRDVCPYYTAWGVDLYELFVNTKSDLGARPEPFKVVCDDDAHAEFLGLRSEEQERLGYERMLYDKLRTLVQSCNRTVSRNKEKLRQEIARNAKQKGISATTIDPAANISQEQLQLCADMMIKVEEMEKEISKLAKDLVLNDGDNDANEKSEQARKENGDSASVPKGKENGEKLVDKDTSLIETIMKKVMEAQMLREQITAAKRSLYYIRGDIQTDKTVCEVSGNFMSSRDADERIAAHFAGKQYVGWKMVRDKLVLLESKFKNRPPPPRGGGSYSSRPPERGSSERNRRGGGSDRRFGDRDRRGGGSHGSRGPPPRDDFRRGSGPPPSRRRYDDYRGGGGSRDRGRRW